MQQLKSGTRLGSRAGWTDAVSQHPAHQHPAHQHPAPRIRRQARDGLLVAGYPPYLAPGSVGVCSAAGWWLT